MWTKFAGNLINLNYAGRFGKRNEWDGYCIHFGGPNEGINVYEKFQDEASRDKRWNELKERNVNRKT